MGPDPNRLWWLPQSGNLQNYTAAEFGQELWWFERLLLWIEIRFCFLLGGFIFYREFGWETHFFGRK